MAKERQELYRQRVPIPTAVGDGVPRASGALFAGGQAGITAPTPIPSNPAAASGRLLEFLFIAAGLAGAGLLAARKFAPAFLAGLNQRLNPWASGPEPERIFPAHVRSEDASFAEFVTQFRVGPSADTRPDSPGPEAMRQQFPAQAAPLITAQRTLLADLNREADGPGRQKILTTLGAEMGRLKDAAGFPEARLVWQVAAAVEGLLWELAGKTGNVTPSTQRAVAGGVELLAELCGPGGNLNALMDRPLKFLVVDDDLISRQALSLALQKAFSPPDVAVDGETALMQAGRQAYDVIFLDVRLPGMDGFELCTKIRGSPLNRVTPVVFVTVQDDFEARARSTLSGGNDLMGKPFLIFEITVKAFTLGLQGRLRESAGKGDSPADSRVSGSAATAAFTPAARSAAIFPGTARRPVPPPAPLEPDRLIQAFLVRAGTELPPLRELCQSLLQTSDTRARQALLADGFLKIKSLISPAGAPRAHPGFQLGAALAGLFRKLLENPENSTASTLATITTAVDLLDELCVPGMPATLGTEPPIELLVVDDDLVTRRAIVGALQTVFQKPESAEDGGTALARAAEKSFDVIFLDVVMPGMDGLEACAKIHETGPNRTTPVVFVTCRDDFHARAQMNQSGGSDFLGKPFLTAEITVKALTFALRGRLEHVPGRPGG